MMSYLQSKNEEASLIQGVYIEQSNLLVSNHLNARPINEM